MTTRERYLTTGQAAAILHVSPKTVSAWAKQGRLPILRTLGGHRRFPEGLVRELERAMHHPGTRA